MPTFKVTLVQAIYVLVTFIHFSNISAITAPILSKNLSQFLGDLIFVNHFLFTKLLLTQIVFGPKVFFLPKYFWPKFFENFFWTHNFFQGPTFFCPKMFFGPKIFVDPKIFFWPQIFLGPNFFLYKNFCWPKNFLDPTFFCNFVFAFVGVVQLIYDLKFLLTQNFITKNFFRPKKFSDLFYFLDHFVWPQNFSDKKSSLNSFQAEHYRLKSCLFNIPKHLYNLLNLQYFAIYIYNLLNLSLYVFKRICICCISG